MRRLNILIVVSGLILIALFLVIMWRRGYWNVFLGAYSFDGDAQLTDYGLGSTRPRYVITFPQVVLSQDGKYEFHCKGLPWETLTFSLRVLDQLSKEDALRDVADACVGFRLVDSNSNTCCTVKRPLKQWILAGRLDEPIEGLFFWTFETRDLKFRPDLVYTFTITVEDVPTNPTKPIQLVPRLSGGGIELP